MNVDSIMTQRRDLVWFDAGMSPADIRIDKLLVRLNRVITE